MGEDYQDMYIDINGVNDSVAISKEVMEHLSSMKHQLNVSNTVKNAINQVPIQDTVRAATTPDYDKICVDQAITYANLSQAMVSLSYDLLDRYGESDTCKKLKTIRKTLKCLDKSMVKRGMDLIVCKQVMEE